MIRELVLDTETTGLDWANGDRLIEIGCVELVNHIATGATFHVYINPRRAVHPDAVAIHGLTDDFLKDKPFFEDIAREFVEFVREDRLVIHNATFDIGFINAELKRLNLPPIMMERVLDTLPLARRKHPMGPNSLDALCARYGIDNSRRVKHGALLDAEILAEVYGELIGGKQAVLGLTPNLARTQADGTVRTIVRARPAPLPPRLTDAELQAHAAFIATLKEPIWNEYVSERRELSA